MNGTKMLFSKQYAFIGDLINGVDRGKAGCCGAGIGRDPLELAALRVQHARDPRARRAGLTAHLRPATTCALFRTSPDGAS